MHLNLITAPQSEPITLTDVEGQVRVASLSDESSTVDIMISAVREQAEALTRRALITQTWELVLDSFASSRERIVLPKPPLQSVVSIIYTDVDGVEQTLSSDLYQVIVQVGPSAGYGYVIPAYNAYWPTTLNDVNVVKIQFKCGYGPLTVGDSDNIPLGIKQWMLLNVANIFENRESIVISSARDSLVDMTKTVADGLISNYKLTRL